MDKEILTQSDTEMANDGRGGRSVEVITDAQAAFIEAYFAASLNASKASRAIGHHPKNGTRMLKNPKVRALIDERLSSMVMSANEVLARLSEQARSDYAEYILENGSVDVAGMVRDNKSHLIKEIKDTAYGVTVKFTDSLEALKLLARYYSLTGDTTNVQVNQISFSTIEVRLQSGDEPMIIEGEVE